MKNHSCERRSLLCGEFIPNFMNIVRSVSCIWDECFAMRGCSLQKAVSGQALARGETVMQQSAQAYIYKKTTGDQYAADKQSETGKPAESCP